MAAAGKDGGEPEQRGRPKSGGIAESSGGRGDPSDQGEGSRDGEKRADKATSRIKNFRRMVLKRDAPRVAPRFPS